VTFKWQTPGFLKVPASDDAETKRAEI